MSFEEILAPSFPRSRTTTAGGEANGGVGGGGGGGGGDGGGGGFVTRLRTWWANTDLDDLLAYETVKVVRIRDYRLGLLQRVLMVGILLYLVVWALIIKQGYLKTEQVSGGAISFTVRPPSVRQSTAELPYCCAFTADCEPPPEQPADRLRCLHWDEGRVYFPEGLSTTLTLTSRVTVSESQASSSACVDDAWDENCRWEPTSDERSFFIANLEDFTLFLRHGVRGQIVHRHGANAGEAENMKGCLRSTIDNSILQCWPTDKRFNDVVDQGPAREGDVLPVSDLLKAAGVTLEDVRL